MAAPDVDPFASIGGGVRLAGGGWAPKGHTLATSAPAAPAPAPGPAAPPGPPTTQQQAYQAPVTVGATPAQGSQVNVAGAFQQALVNKLAPGQASAQSAELQPALQANRLAEQRGLERNRSMVAERAASQGLDQNAFNTQLTGLAQERAGRESAFEGQQVADLGKRQSQDIMSALALAGGGLGQLQGFSQQRDLADLSALLTREGNQLQGDLGRGDLALRGRLGDQQGNLSLLSMLLNNQQFGQRLGADVGMFSAGLNQDAMSRLLGGL